MGRLQLLQPAPGVVASAVVLQTVPPVMAVAAVVIVLCVADTKRFT